MKVSFVWFPRAKTSYSPEISRRPPSPLCALLHQQTVLDSAHHTYDLYLILTLIDISYFFYLYVKFYMQTKGQFS